MYRTHAGFNPPVWFDTRVWQAADEPLTSLDHLGLGLRSSGHSPQASQIVPAPFNPCEFSQEKRDDPPSRPVGPPVRCLTPGLHEPGCRSGARRLEGARGGRGKPAGGGACGAGGTVRGGRGAPSCSGGGSDGCGGRCPRPGALPASQGRPLLFLPPPPSASPTFCGGLGNGSGITDCWERVEGDTRVTLQWGKA